MKTSLMGASNQLRLSVLCHATTSSHTNYNYKTYQSSGKIGVNHIACLHSPILTFLSWSFEQNLKLFSIITVSVLHIVPDMTTNMVLIPMVW